MCSRQAEAGKASALCLTLRGAEHHQLLGAGRRGEFCGGETATLVEGRVDPKAAVR